MTRKPQMDLAFEQLRRLYEAMSDLRDRYSQKSPAAFAAMAESPLEEIRRLRQEIDTFSGVAQATEAESPIWLRVVGDSVQWPETSTSVLTNALDSLRKGVLAVAEMIVSGAAGHRPTEALRSACDFQIVRLAHGSLKVGLRLPEEVELNAQNGSAARTALRDLITAGQTLALEGDDGFELRFPEQAKRKVLLAELLRLAPKERGSIDRVELSARGSYGTLSLDKNARLRIVDAIMRMEDVRTRQWVGWIRELDLDSRSFTLRTESGRRLVCHARPEELEIAHKLLGQMARVVGILDKEGRRTSIDVFELASVDEGSFETPS